MMLLLEHRERELLLEFVPRQHIFTLRKDHAYVARGAGAAVIDFEAVIVPANLDEISRYVSLPLASVVGSFAACVASISRMRRG